MIQKIITKVNRLLNKPIYYNFTQSKDRYIIEAVYKNGISIIIQSGLVDNKAGQIIKIPRGIWNKLKFNYDSSTTKT